MLLYITYAVLVLIAIFMAISASVTSPFGNRKLKLAIGIVIATAIVTALFVGGYTQYKYDTASVEKGEKLKGHVVEGTNKLHDVDGYAVTEK